MDNIIYYLKGKTYILEGTQVFRINKGTKGKLYGTYSPKTGKVKKVYVL